MSEHYNQIKAAGGQLVAISSELTIDQREARRQRQFEYQFLSDPAKDVIKRYGVFNPEDDRGVFPSIFILDKDGVIRWMYVGKNASDRPDTKIVVEALKKVS